MEELKDFINNFCKDIYQDNKAKGFWQSREEWMLVPEVKKALIGQQLMLIVSEIAEAMEADRMDLMDDKLPHRKGLEVELADAAIRIFDMAGGLEMDLGGAIIEKLKYNRSREYKHGKNY